MLYCACFSSYSFLLRPPAGVYIEEERGGRACVATYVGCCVALKGVLVCSGIVIRTNLIRNAYLICIGSILNKRTQPNATPRQQG
jgi:hypothetical protein